MEAQAPEMDECLSGFAKCWSLLEFDYSAQALNNALPADVPVLGILPWGLCENGGMEFD